MPYELPTDSFLKNIAYVRSSLQEKFPSKSHAEDSIVDDYNKEIRLAGNSIIKIKEIMNKYLAILNDNSSTEKKKSKKSQ